MITAVYRKVPVEILDLYESQKIKYAAIRSLDNKPFEIDRWPVKARYATVKTDMLNKITPGLPLEIKNLNLLEMSLTYRVKRQWYAGESIWLWRNDNEGAFLKEELGLFVSLNVTGFRDYLHIFYLNHETWKWELCNELESKYKRWAEKALESRAYKLGEVTYSSFPPMNKRR